MDQQHQASAICRMIKHGAKATTPTMAQGRLSVGDSSREKCLQIAAPDTMVRLGCPPECLADGKVALI